MRVLAVGAHPVDVEIGCGGALIAHRDRGDEIHLLVMTGEHDRAHPLRRGEQELAAGRLGAVLHWGGFEDGAVPAGRESIATVESVIVANSCDVVYAPVPEDTHQDHRATGEAALSASRRSLQVLCYEAPTTLAFVPAVFVDLEGRVGAKLELLGVHRSQVEESELVDLSAVAASARYRGAQARVGHAEAFQSHRFVWELAPAPAVGVDRAAPWGARSVLGRASAAGPTAPIDRRRGAR
ncbi:MAG TPA: PIG-L deacetylase family protein [Acidimicrobiales bacterium]|nr:PIG-L deacetylase family protein [Acidimicrobiales bacterium]